MPWRSGRCRLRRAVGSSLIRTNTDLRPGAAGAAAPTRWSTIGGSDTAQVAAFVNPTAGEPVQPVLQGLDDQQLARIAMACARRRCPRGRAARGSGHHGAGACARRAHRGAGAARTADHAARRRVRRRDLPDRRGRSFGADRRWPDGVRGRSGRRRQQRAAADAARGRRTRRGKRRAARQSAADRGAGEGEVVARLLAPQGRPYACGRRQLRRV